MRIQSLAAAAAAAFVLMAGAAHAQTPPAPMLIYDDALSPDWQNWSWNATITMQAPAGNVKPIKVEGTPWSALDFHHDAFSTAGYTKLTFYINGGVDGGQTLTVHVKTPDGKSPEGAYTFQPKTKAWAMVTVPLKDIGADNKTITDVFIQGGADVYKPYYIDKVVLQ